MMEETLNPWMVATIILGAVLAVVVVRHVLIITDQNLWRKYFGFVPNPHDPMACARLVAEKLEAARTEMYDADREVDRLEKLLYSTRRWWARANRDLAKMERMARKRGFGLVPQT